MPSPFPGIDPYLESQWFGSDFCSSLIVYCCDALNDQLPESYDARLDEQRRLIEHRDQHVVKEIEEVRDVWIEIRHRPDRELITAIEVLSPTNKTGEGYWVYQAKRAKLIRQNVHLVELDLLVRGQRLPMRRELPRADFYAFVSRAGQRPRSDVFVWSVRHPLPRIPIPLRPPDPDVILDLPSLFAFGYERGRYARALDYSAPLDLPLASADRTWAEDLARKSRS